MFFSYTVSVLLLSLAMYGMGCALYDLWKWWIGPRFFSNISCSFLVLAGKDGQDTVDLLQYILRETEMTEMECDVVVILESSRYLTTHVLKRLAEEHADMKVLCDCTVNEGLALCRGQVVHLLDGRRITGEEGMAAVGKMLER